MFFLREIVMVTSLLHFSNGGLNELCEQIDFFTHRGLFHCLSYDEYGCWCGPGGSGTPVDGSDACCEEHDHCYDNILTKKECNPYLAQYSFSKANCLDEPGTCLREICDCDQAISKCLSNQTYHWTFYGYRLYHKC